MSDLHANREFYTHDSDCDPKKDLQPPLDKPANEFGLRACTNCLGVFDEKGEGVAVTSKRFDEPPPNIELGEE